MSIFEAGCQFFTLERSVDTIKKTQKIHKALPKKRLLPASLTSNTRQTRRQQKKYCVSSRLVLYL